MTDRNPSAHEKRIQQLAADVAARLRGVCRHLSDAEFDELVMDIVRMKLRFDALEDRPGGLRPLRRKSDSSDS